AADGEQHQGRHAAGDPEGFFPVDGAMQRPLANRLGHHAHVSAPPCFEPVPAAHVAGGLKREPPGTMARAVVLPAGIRRWGWKAGSSRPDCFFWKSQGLWESLQLPGIPRRLNAGSPSSPLPLKTRYCNTVI